MYIIFYSTVVSQFMGVSYNGQTTKEPKILLEMLSKIGRITVCQPTARY